MASILDTIFSLIIFVPVAMMFGSGDVSQEEMSVIEALMLQVPFLLIYVLFEGIKNALDTREVSSGVEDSEDQ